MKHLPWVSLLLWTLTSSAQTAPIETTLRNPNDSLVNHYLTLKPQGMPKGLLLLLPGYGEYPALALLESDIANQAAARGLFVVVATLQEGPSSLCFDERSQATLDGLIPELAAKYDLKGKKFYLGGMSIGGSGVVKYAERAYSSSSLVRPNAVFAIDPPLDLIRFCQSLAMIQKYSRAEPAINEANFFLDRFRKEFKGDVQSQRQVYLDQSPFCYGDTTLSAIRPLVNVPIRLIAEPDIDWYLKERGTNYYNLNSLDCSAMISYLRALGSTKAELVVTSGRGYRKQTGKRHPHSWSIAHSKQTVDWLLSQK